VIVFSAFLVVVAVALLIVGVVTSKLTLVYIAIGVSGVALLALGAGVLFRRREVFGESEAAKSEAAKSEAAKSEAAQPEASQPQPVPAAAYSKPAAYSGPAAYSEPPASQQAAAVPAGSGWPAEAAPTAQSAQSGPPVAGYLPTQQPPARPPSGRPADYQRPPDMFTPLPAAAASSQVWEWRDDAPPAKPPAPAQDQSPAASAPPAEQAATDQHPPEDQQASEDPKASEPDQRAGVQPAEHPVASADSESQAAPQAVPAPTEPAAAQPAPEADLQREVSVVPGVPRYHNARCILIRFMDQDDLDKMTVAAAKQAGCTPCRACLPDQPEKASES
jgi:translation initiation factor IF-2